MKYFLECETLFGNRLVFVSADKLEGPTEEILGALGLMPARAIPAGLRMTNRGPRELPDWINGRFDELFAAEASVCLELFARACTRSDADFAGYSPKSGPAPDAGPGAA